MLIKILHMTAGLLTVLLFVLQAYLLLERRNNLEEPRDDVVGLVKVLKIGSHIVWTLLIAAGIWLFIQLPIYPYWLLAKIGLFVCALVFSILAFRGKSSRKLQNIGLIGATICYVLIVYLVVAKPGGYILTGSVNQPVAGSASEAGQFSP